jgi:hypothetical protein
MYQISWDGSFQEDAMDLELTQIHRQIISPVLTAVNFLLIVLFEVFGENLLDHQYLTRRLHLEVAT